MVRSTDLRLGQQSRAMDGEQKLSVAYGAATPVGCFVTFKEETVNGTKLTRAVLVSTLEENIIGVSLVNKKSGDFQVGETGHVLTNGVVFMEAHEVIKKGAKISAHTDGTAVTADDGTATILVNAYALTNATAGEIVEVKVNI